MFTPASTRSPPPDSLFHSLVTIPPDVVDLNAGTHSRTPLRVLRAQRKAQDDYEANPTWGLMTLWRKLWPIQVRLAQFFGADPNSLFFRANITQVINELILGIPLPKQSALVMTQLEYGAVKHTCRFRAERDSLELIEIQLPATATASEASILEAVEAQLPANTGLLVISHVFTGTGFIVPIDKIAKLARARGIRLIVDGAHAAGYLDVQLAELGAVGVDGYAANLHKWMLGPKGTSFGWLAPDLHEGFRPIMAGWPTYPLAVSSKWPDGLEKASILWLLMPQRC